jgi:hypothetical protein
MRRLIHPILPAAFLAISCGGDCPSDDRYDGDPGGNRVVRLWVDADPGLDGPIMREGCDLWSDLGVTCTLVEDEDGAQVRVYADPAPCEPGDDGRTTLARAFGDGSIVFYVECFVSRDLLGRERVDWDAVRGVMGHEFGHVAGIWRHVPRSCEEDVLWHPDGGPVCGRALMNATYDPAVDYVTNVDALAFDLRDRKNSVLDAGDAHRGHGPSGLPDVICDLPLPVPVP